jgi:hypothetical protein
VLDGALTKQDCWKTFVATKDNLSLNLCIMGMEEAEVERKLASGIEDLSSSATHLHLNCCGHSAVLATKPVTDRLGDMPGKMVRMGHLHESGRTAADHNAFVLPIDFDRWQQTARHVLRVSRPAMDLTPIDEDLIMRIDNGDWDSPNYVHWCLGPLCAAKCGGEPLKALSLMRSAVSLSIGGVAATPLKYRWKGMDAFLAKLYRGMRQHSTWLHSHRMLWPKEKVRRAMAEIDRLGGDENAPINNDVLRFKTQIRGGRTVEFLEGDAEAFGVEHAIVLNCGVQFYLNKCFAADAAVSEYGLRLQMISASCTNSPDEHTQRLRAVCIERNLSIISGEAGLEVLAMYSQYFEYGADVWQEWRLTCDKRYAACLDMIVVMQDVSYRLVFKHDQPKHEIFGICRIPEGVAYDAARVRQIAARLGGMHELCSLCVDKAFTLIWTHRLLEMGSAASRDAHTAMCDILALLRVTSTKVEKKHLLGQELKPAKRGACVECCQLARLVFRESVIRASDVHRQESQSRCLNNDPSLVRNFMHTLNDSLVGGHADRRSGAEVADGPLKYKQLKALAFDSRMQKRPQRGYDAFVSQNYHAGIDAGSDHVFDKRKSLDDDWRALSTEEKDVYSELAKDENEKVAERGCENYVQFLQRHSALSESRATKKRARYVSDRRRAVQRTLRDMLDHDVFLSGAQIHDFDSGIRAALMLPTQRWNLL